MLSNKIEFEVIRTNSGNIRLARGGASYLVPDTMENTGLLANLEIELLYSLEIYNKMDFNVGDRVSSGGILGTITEAKDNELEVIVLMDDDNKKLSINRKYIEKLENGK